MAGTSPKSGVVALLLCFFLGPFGVHRFYAGKIGSGIAQLLTLGGMGFWALYDLIMIALGKFTDADGNVMALSNSSSSSSSSSSTRRAA